MSQITAVFQAGGSGTVVTLTGNSGGAVPPTAGNINVVGSGAITVTGNPGTSTLTITDTGGGIPWTVITVNQTAAINNGYICNKAGTLALALPAVSPVGSIIRITNINTALGWQITQAAGQQVFFGNASTTAGALGTLTSSALGDSIEIVCTVANLTWQAVSMIGNLTPA